MGDFEYKTALEHYEAAAKNGLNVTEERMRSANLSANFDLTLSLTASTPEEKRLQVRALMESVI